LHDFWPDSSGPEESVRLPQRSVRKKSLESQSPPGAQRKTKKLGVLRGTFWLSLGFMQVVKNYKAVHHT
jgi:hypothetical protein